MHRSSWIQNVRHIPDRNFILRPDTGISDSMCAVAPFIRRHTVQPRRCRRGLICHLRGSPASILRRRICRPLQSPDYPVCGAGQHHQLTDRGELIVIAPKSMKSPPPVPDADDVARWTMLMAEAVDLGAEHPKSSGTLHQRPFTMPYSRAH